jgi:hypothetical protein
MRTTFKGISTLVLFVCFFICLQNCDFSMDRDGVNFVECVGELDLGTFYFLGTHDSKSIEYYENKDNYIESFGSIVSVTFEDDKTFIMDVKIACDSLSSVPACDSINFAAGYKEFRLEGSWNFEQHVKTHGSGSWRTNRMEGQCNLNITESTNDMLNGENLTSDTHIDCTPSTVNYWMNIDLPINDGDRLHAQISFEKLK